jgi:dihydroorotase
MNAAPIYDLILQGGHVICPASGIEGVMDVAIASGKIALVGKDILPSTAQQVIDIRGKLVLPGMIDTHAHVYRYVTGRFGLKPTW